MGVVLGESAHPGQAVKLATLLVAVHGAKLCKAKRQVAVGARLRLINFAVVRAIHRLEQVLLAFFGGVNGLKGVLAVLLIVARKHIKLLARNVGRDYRQVARLFLRSLQKVLQSLAQCGAFGQPQGQSLTHFLAKREKL